MIDRLTVGKYQAINAIDEPDEIKKGIQIISVLDDIKPDDVRKWPVQKFKQKLNEYTTIDLTPYENKRVKRLTLGGVVHELVDNPANMTSGQFIDIVEAMKGNDQPISYMHLVLAIMAKEKPSFADRVLKKIHGEMYSDYDPSKVQERAKQIQELPLQEVWGVFVFFYNLYFRYLEITEDYLTEQMEKTMSQAKQLLK